MNKVIIVCSGSAGATAVYTPTWELMASETVFDGISSDKETSEASVPLGECLSCALANARLKPEK